MPTEKHKENSDTLVPAKDLKEGLTIRVPGKRKARKIKVIGPALSSTRGDKIPPQYEGHYLIVFEDCKQLVLPPDFKVIVE